jgi:hypothetical protein
VSSAPSRPGQQGGDGVVRGERERIEESAKLVDGQCDQPGRGGCGVAFGCGGHGQEGVGEHGRGGPSMPGAPAPDLVLIEPDQSFGGLEGFLDALPAGGVVAADQQMVDPTVVVFGQQPNPGP